MPNGLHYARLWLAIGVLLIGIAVWFSLANSPPGWLLAWDQRPLHAMVYAVLMFWFGLIYGGIWRQLGLAVAFISMGLALEGLQPWLTTTRRLDGYDAAANAAGTIAGWVLLRTAAGGWLRWFDARLAAWMARR